MQRIFRLFLIIAVACVFINCDGKKDKEIDSSKIDTIGLVVSNFSADYQYNLSLNNEPLYYGSNMAIFSWQGYPLIKGENELKIIFKRVSAPYEKITDIRLNIAVVDGDKVIKNESVNAQLVNGTKSEKIFRFYSEDIQNNSINYQKLHNIPIDNVQEDVKHFALKLIGLLAKRDFYSIEKFMDIKNGMPILTKYPKWFTEAKDSEIRIIAAKNFEDIELVVGNRLILVRPSKMFIQKGKSKDLFYVEDIKSKANISKTCVVFAKVKNNWGLLEQEGFFYRLLNKEGH